MVPALADRPLATMVELVPLSAHVWTRGREDGLESEPGWSFSAAEQRTVLGLQDAIGPQVDLCPGFHSLFVRTEVQKTDV